MSEKFYKIGEFARLVGLSTSTIRAYEKSGILIPHHKTPEGYRVYSDKQYKDFIDGKLTKPSAISGGGV